MNVLFVCTGNVCRSPMAEGFLKREALERGLDLSVRSTGTHAWAGRTATWDGRQTMSRLGTPIDGHRTLLLDPELVDWADLAIGLAAEHVRDVGRDYPHAGGKVFGLKELVALLPQVPASQDDIVAAAHAARGCVAGLRDTDVMDPYGDRAEAYERVALEIRDLISVLAAQLESRMAGAAR